LDIKTYVRQYIPLKNFGTGINGLPITEEYRFFILDGKIISSDFYWSEHLEYIKEEYDFVPNSKMFQIN
jgi:hypothetical protein